MQFFQWSGLAGYVIVTDKPLDGNLISTSLDISYQNKTNGMITFGS